MGPRIRLGARARVRCERRGGGRSGRIAGAEWCLGMNSAALIHVACRTSQGRTHISVIHMKKRDMRRREGSYLGLDYCMSTYLHMIGGYAHILSQIRMRPLILPMRIPRWIPPWPHSSVVQANNRAMRLGGCGWMVDPSYGVMAHGCCGPICDFGVVLFEDLCSDTP